MLELRFTKFSEITLRHSRSSRSPILVAIERRERYDFLLVIITLLTYLISYTISKLWLIIGQIFASERRVPHINALAGGLHNPPQKQPNLVKLRCGWAIMPLKVIQGHRVWYQSKLICDFLSVTNTNLAHTLHCFRDIAVDRSKIAIFGHPSYV